MGTFRQLLLELETEAEIKKEIGEYQKLQSDIERNRTSIKEVLATIADKEKLADRKYKIIMSNMKKQNIAEIKFKKWVVKLATALKYKRISPDYKTLYLNLLDQVNAKLKKVADAELDAHKELKMKATMDVLQFEGVFDKLKNLWKKFTGWFKASDGFSKAVDKLPEIK